MTLRSTSFPESESDPNNSAVLQSANFGSSDLALTESTSWILAGWMKYGIQGPSYFHKAVLRIYSGATTLIDIIITDVNEDGTGDPRVGLLTYNGTTFSTRAISTNEVSPNTAFFIRAWLDPGSGNIYLQINNNTPISAPISLSSFSFATPYITFLSRGTVGNSTGGIVDEWMFAKNPSSLVTALSVTDAIYNSGNGLEYAALTPTQKTDLGLVSWWGFDEIGSGTRFDLQSSTDLTVVDGDVIDSSPLVTGNTLFLNLNDSVSVTSSESNLATYVRSLLEAFLLGDITEIQLNKALSEFVFLSDTVRTSPLLKLNTEILKLSDWLNITRNQPNSIWYD